jgi:D-alanyl-D-alanine carboxypeptidase (penicillin-binding protein 5/6)
MMRLFAVFATVVAFAVPAWGFETRATAAYVVDVTTDTVLLSKRADVPMPPASMSKLMTLNMLFEAIEDGRVTLDTEFRVSAKAAGKGGSKMFLAEGSRASVQNLIQGIIVHSGNDACITVAEGLAGTEDHFAELMTQRADALGMTQSNFANASGWPDPGQRMSMRDLVTLGTRLQTYFPQYYHYFQQEEFTWADITQKNRNPLLSLGIGADGLKTGHTEEAGYGLVGTAKQGKRRIVFAITGLPSAQARAEEAERIVNWAFRQFVERELAPAGTKLADLRVWMGQARTVPAETAAPLEILVPAVGDAPLVTRIEYIGPIEAPIAIGQPIAELVIEVPDLQERRVPLIAGAAVDQGGLLPRLQAAASVLWRSLRAQTAEMM